MTPLTAHPTLDYGKNRRPTNNKALRSIPTYNPNTAMSEKRFLSRKELAERYGVNVETISRWVRRGCPVRRASAYRSPMLFDPAEVDAWLATPKTPTKK